jgi:hypothetical protein
LVNGHLEGGNRSLPLVAHCAGSGKPGAVQSLTHASGAVALAQGAGNVVAGHLARDRDGEPRGTHSIADFHSIFESCRSSSTVFPVSLDIDDLHHHTTNMMTTII